VKIVGMRVPFLLRNLADRDLLDVSVGRGPVELALDRCQIGF
jgi:hypothetical protein